MESVIRVKKNGLFKHLGSRRLFMMLMKYRIRCREVIIRFGDLFRNSFHVGVEDMGYKKNQR